MCTALPTAPGGSCPGSQGTPESLSVPTAVSLHSPLMSPRQGHLSCGVLGSGHSKGTAGWLGCHERVLLELEPTLGSLQLLSGSLMLCPSPNFTSDQLPWL